MLRHVLVWVAATAIALKALVLSPVDPAALRYGPRDTTYHVLRADAPPLDGDLGKWANVPAVSLDTSNASYVQGVINSPADASLTLQGVWSPTALVFAIHVNDDRIVVDPLGEVDSPTPQQPHFHPYWMDEIEIAVNADSTHRSYANHQFTLNPDGFRTDSSLSLSNFQFVTRTVSGGWDAEIKLSVQNELGTGLLSTNSPVSFTFAYHDADGDNPHYYDGYMIWAGGQDGQTTTWTEGWGNLVLSNATANFDVTATATPTPGTPTATLSPTPTPSLTPTARPTSPPTTTPTSTPPNSPTFTPPPTNTPAPTLTLAPTASPTPSTGTIRGLVWNDLDHNGQFTPGEPGLAGAQVALLDVNGSPLALAVTQGDGQFIFAERPPGFYKVRATLPDGYTTSTPMEVVINMGTGQSLNLEFGGYLGPTALPTTLIDISSAQPIACNSTVSGNTLNGQAHVNRYACRPAWDESGREVAYRFSLGTPAPIVAELRNLPVDLDVFLLDNADPNSCRAGADTTLSADLPAGTYYLVVDGFMNTAGSFNLNLMCGQSTAILTATPTRSLPYRLYLPVSWRALISD